MRLEFRDTLVKNKKLILRNFSIYPPKTMLKHVLFSFSEAEAILA